MSMTSVSSKVIALFESARANGLKWPKIRLQTEAGQRVVLHQAGDSSRYKGQVMVTDGGPYGANRYFGRIDEQGTLQEGRDMQDDVLDLLDRLAQNPEAVATEYGRLTGHCCFCALTLKDERSIAVGYGPVCAEKFGLQWGHR